MSAKSLKPLESGNESVSLGKLSRLTGFPEEFIKRELILDEEGLTLPLLRERAIRYLDGIYGVEADNGHDISTGLRPKRAS